MIEDDAEWHTNEQTGARFPADAILRIKEIRRRTGASLNDALQAARQYGYDVERAVAALEDR